MQRIKRMTGLLALAALSFALTSCSQKSETGQGGGFSSRPGSGASKRIVFVFKVAGLSYSEACKRGAMQADKELSPQGVRVEYRAPAQATVGNQIDIIQQLIAEKPDAIVVSPNDAEGICPILAKAKQAGIKVFTWDSDAPNSGRIFYVAAADDVQIGRDIADALAKDIGDKGEVQIVSGGRGAANLNLHVQGMEEAFKKYPGITLVQPYIYNDDDNTKARSMAVQALQKDPNIVGFACANSPSAPAVGQAITSLNKIGQVKVWGLALPSETRQYLKSGAVSGLMLWDPAKLTYLTAILVNNYIDGKPPKDGATYPGIGKIKVNGPFVLMPGVTITKDNVDQFNF